DAAPPDAAAPDAKPPIALALEAPAALVAGERVAFRLTARFADGATRDATADATWAADNSDIIDFSGGPSDAALPYGGATIVRATLGGQTVEQAVTVTCPYPRFTASIRYQEALAPVRWANAYREDGTQAPFDFRAASCAAEYQDVTAFFLIANAEWCGPCIREINRVGRKAQALREAGGLVVYVVIQNLDYGLATGEVAFRHINRLVGDDSPGVTVGGLDAEPQGVFDNPAIIDTFPTSFVVRKRDMVVVGDSRVSGELDRYFLSMLADLDADWSNPEAIAGLPFDSQCLPGEEEAGEPNDLPEQATPIGFGVHRGGVCAPEPDYYRIEEAGDWTLQLAYDPREVDMAMAPWDDAAGAILEVDGVRVIAHEGAGLETLSGTGPATILVGYYEESSGDYTLTLAPAP
ncbi:MAG: hypothetical protein KC549_15555, partial [Myxococcales bacterium]|nr:hypothetical protein [Myxococcales bacterium]